MPSIQQLHEEMQHALRRHHETLHMSEVPSTFSKSWERSHQFLPAYWLNKYFAAWDALETVGLSLQIELPGTPHFPSDQSIQWSAHNGFEEPKRIDTTIFRFPPFFPR